MTSSRTLALVAAWFIFGMARIVFTSRLAEHRIDNPDRVSVLSNNRAAASARHDATNYDSRGRRLLSWYRAVNITYWVLVAGACWWAVFNA